MFMKIIPVCDLYAKKHLKLKEKNITERIFYGDFLKIIKKVVLLPLRY